MKTKQSLKNTIFTIIEYIILIIVGFVSQKIFINILGVEYLGLNGLFNNLIYMLGIFELGIGSAIIYNLYKPFVNKDVETINSLMKFYKMAYRFIAIAVAVFSLILFPFLGLIITDITVNVNIKVVYLLFVTDIVVSYFLSYKRSILYADQKNYIINIIHVIYYTVLNILQLVYLYISKDYYGYLIIKIIMRIVENVAITIYVNKKYAFLNIGNAKKLDKSILHDIKKKISALFLHKIAGLFVLGTDNIIISRMFGIVSVGLYSNYHLVIDSLYKLFSQAINAITPSVGHLLVENNKEKNYSVFKKIRFINFWIAVFTSTGLLIVMEPFIILWLGDQYLLSLATLITLVINYYQKVMRSSYNSFKDAAGIYYEDRYVPLLESVTNIIVSILCAMIFGLPGVFMGTIISGLWLWCYSYPKYIYTKLFNRSYKNYYIETFGYIGLAIIIVGISFAISSKIIVSNIMLSMIINMLITLIVPNIIIIILFRNTDNYKYLLSLVKKIFKR